MEILFFMYNSFLRNSGDFLKTLSWRHVSFKASLFFTVMGTIAFSSGVRYAQAQANGPGEEFHVEEINSFLAAITALPVDATQWLACIFWFLLVVTVGYVIGSLSVIALSDTNTPQRTIYGRQLLFFIVGSIAAMLGSNYLSFSCLVMPFAILALVLVIGGLWYLVRRIESESKPTDDTSIDL